MEPSRENLNGETAPVFPEPPAPPIPDDGATRPPRRFGARGAGAAVLAALVFAASGGGYLIGRRDSGGTSSASGSGPSAAPAINNNGNSTNGSTSPFGRGFGGFSFGDGSGSSGSNSSGSSASGSSASGTTTSANGQKVASKVDAAIVDVTSTLSDGEAKGTGMVITSDGEILTNNHVISGATSIHVQFVTTGKTYSASLVGYDASHDVALLKISHVSGLATIKSSSSSARSGQSVVVIGNANGQDGTPAVVDGSVTNTNQTITASDEGGYESETLNGLVELSANVVSGDSGGAVTDSNGRVIAMTTAVWEGGGSVAYNTSGNAYAIPIGSALSVVHEIEDGHESSTLHLGEHGLLGVGVEDVNGGGAGVAEVASGTAAASAGLQEGDVITAVNGTTIASANALNAAMAKTHVGDRITVQWQDANGASHQATVTLHDGVA
jgi:S1-C subfamily serine protease